jgi:hypothetical protein
MKEKQKKKGKKKEKEKQEEEEKSVCLADFSTIMLHGSFVVRGVKFTLFSIRAP